MEDIITQTDEVLVSHSGLAHDEWEEPRENKEIHTGKTWRERDGILYRMIFEVIQQTITADDQRLLVPEIESDTWWTALKLSAKQVIAL
jgi:hypothetical protein